MQSKKNDGAQLRYNNKKTSQRDTFKYDSNVKVIYRILQNFNKKNITSDENDFANILRMSPR